jgi:hypothetical protein
VPADGISAATEESVDFGTSAFCGQLSDKLCLPVKPTMRAFEAKNKKYK